MEVRFIATGTPKPQGPKKVIKGLAIETCKKLPGWRKAVAASASREMGGKPMLSGALEATVTFFFRRPQKDVNRHGETKPGRPRFVTKTPDLDKLLRAVFDAMTGVVYQNDAIIAEVTARKLFLSHNNQPECAFIRVAQIETGGTQ